MTKSIAASLGFFSAIALATLLFGCSYAALIVVPSDQGVGAREDWVVLAAESVSSIARNFGLSEIHSSEYLRYGAATADDRYPIRNVARFSSGVSDSPRLLVTVVVDKRTGALEVGIRATDEFTEPPKAASLRRSIVQALQALFPERRIQVRRVKDLPIGVLP